jgi:hypothetical protein
MARKESELPVNEAWHPNRPLAVLACRVEGTLRSSDHQLIFFEVSNYHRLSGYAITDNIFQCVAYSVLLFLFYCLPMLSIELLSKAPNEKENGIFYAIEPVSSSF